MALPHCFSPAYSRLEGIIHACQGTNCRGDSTPRPGALRYRLKALLEPDHNDEFVVINVENGDYFLDTSDLEALRAARTEYPARVLFLARVGAETAYRIGYRGRACHW